MIKRLLKADWLYTAAGSPIKDGMIAIDDKDTISAIGQNLSEGGIVVEVFDGILCPAFVNAHCHLELSHLKGKIEQGGKLDGFIQEVQHHRTADDAEVQKAIVEADQEMIENGIIAVGDISNGLSTISQKSNSPIHYHTFIELFAFDPSKADQSMRHGKENQAHFLNSGLKATVVPHSPYSVSTSLMDAIAKHNVGPVCIHNQETQGENELFRAKKGAMAEMLKDFGNSLDHFEAQGKSSLISYLPILQNNTPLQLVHNTFTSRSDIQEAEKLHKEIYWCFCPRANQYIEGRLPDMNLFAEAAVKGTLGTDSLASNQSLSILEEMKSIQGAFPNISLEILIQWGSINGAKFLGIEKEYGSIELGKRAKINHISKIKDQKLTAESKVYVV